MTPTVTDPREQERLLTEQALFYVEVNADTSFGDISYLSYIWNIALVTEQDARTSNGRPFDPTTLQFSSI